MITLSEIKSKLYGTKIKLAQLDPNGVCNGSCWYCPVRYLGNPEHERSHMPVELLEKILADICNEASKPDGVVEPYYHNANFFIYTCHYNEVLLYRHFKEMLDLFRKYRVHSMILSNGIALTPDKVDLICEYPDVLHGSACLNIPAFEPLTWGSKVLGRGDASSVTAAFEKLVANVQYAASKLNGLSIQINCQPEDGEEIDRQYGLAKGLFPGVNVFKAVGMHDRAGILADLGVVDNKAENPRPAYVHNCRNTFEGLDGRMYSWLHVSPTGKAFLCCNDYNMEHVFGDFQTQSLAYFWRSDQHAQAIQDSFEGICRRCCMASWRSGV